MMGMTIPVWGWCGNSLVTPAGEVLKWGSREIVYHVDPGGLGKYTNEFMRQLVIRAFNQWSDVVNSDLNLVYGGLLEEDITSTNYATVINNAYDGINPVIFDSDGTIVDSIIELIFGKGASDYTLGFGTPLTDPMTGEIVEAEIIINGKILATSKTNAIERVYSTLLHEIGHFIGLGHSQLHLDFAFDEDPSNNLFLPVMFPIETEDQFSSQSLSQDDCNILSTLYPKQSKMALLGNITGTVQRPYGDGVQGANVVAAKSDSPLIYAYSCVSDFYINYTGEFHFVGLPPGQYEIYVEPIYPGFWGSSAVGPFAEFQNSPSFSDPVVKEYYNGNRESGYINRDKPEDRVFIDLAAGQTVDGIHIITNEEMDPSSFDGWPLYD